jgi:hypothetical protein
VDSKVQNISTFVSHTGLFEYQVILLTASNDATCDNIFLNEVKVGHYGVPFVLRAVLVAKLLDHSKVGMV